MDFRKQTEELNTIPIQTIASWLGISLPKMGSASCPFPDHEDKNPSFEIKKSGLSWICYGCNRRGGSIDFLKNYNNIDFVTAKRWLEERAGSNYSSRKAVPIQQLVSPPVTKKTVIESDAAVEADSEVYEYFLELCPLQDSGRDYLMSRAISENTIATYRVGELTQSVLSALLKKFGFKRLNESGLLTTKSSAENCRMVMPKGSLIFPFMENDRVVYIQARTIGAAEQYGKWRNLNHHRRRIYNADSITNESSRPFAICEGVIDALSAIELAYDSIGIMGVTAELTANQLKNLRKKEVNILLDWDDAGEKKAAKLQKELNQYGVVCTRKNRPSPRVKDLNEYLMETRGRA